MTDQEKELNLLVMGNEGLIMKIRMENQFDKQIFDRVIEILKEYFSKNKGRRETSNEIAFTSIFLADALAGGSNFFDDKTTEMVEDASTELLMFFEGIASEK